MAKGIQSITLGFRLLKAVADCDAPASLKAIATAGEMSPSKARMYLISLIETGLVAQNAETGLYSLGPFALHLGARALQRMEMVEAANDAMRALQRKTKAHVLLCTWSERGIIIVSRTEGVDALPLNFRLGGSHPIASTATGQIFLAFGPQEETWAHLTRELQELRLSKSEQRKRVRELEKAVVDVRKHKIAEADPIAYDSGVTLSGFAAIAAPVFDFNQHLRHVLTLIYRTNQPHLKRDELLLLTREASARTSSIAGVGSF